MLCASASRLLSTKHGCLRHTVCNANSSIGGGIESVLAPFLGRHMSSYAALPDQTDELLITQEKSTVTVTLNKPKTLNSLTQAMVASLNVVLPALPSNNVTTLLVKSTPHPKIKAFCAGGDVRKVYDSGLGLVDEGNGSKCTEDFFFDEYRMNYKSSQLLDSHGISQVSIWDGIVMGGGVGVSIHGAYRIATENTVLAMPETGIGLFPDVGGMWWLPRLEGGLGAYVGLTGARLKSDDLLYCGVATHFVDSSNLTEMEVELINSGEDAVTVLERFNSPKGTESSLEKHRATIDKCFDGKSCVEDIVVALQKLEGAEKEEFGNKALKLLGKGSSLSLKVTLEGLRRGKQLSSIEQALSMEYNMSQGFMRVECSDFYEGIRALLVDKDNSPSWIHGEALDGGLEKITDDIVGEFFEVRGRDWSTGE